MRSFLIGLALAVTVPGATMHSACSAATDEDRAQLIANSLKNSGELKNYRVGVKYEDGVAWLTGTVVSHQQKQIAERLARQCNGVQQVVSKIQVSPTDAPSDVTERSSASKVRQASNSACVSHSAAMIP